MAGRPCGHTACFHLPMLRLTALLSESLASPFPLLSKQEYRIWRLAQVATLSLVEQVQPSPDQTGQKKPVFRHW